MTSRAQTLLLAVLVGLGVTAPGVTAPAAAQPAALDVFAATSLRDALTEIGKLYAQRHGVEPTFNFGGSNELARQIIAAERGDVFLSADTAWMDRVAEAGLVAPGTRRDVLSNVLVVVVRDDSELRMANPEAFGAVPFRHLALGDPQAVPVGRYAKAYLSGLKGPRGVSVWEEVEARVVPASDARMTLAMVEADPEVLGIVYRSDAASSRRVRVLYTVPEAAGPRIRYQGAAIRRDGASPRAREFLDFLADPAARAVFTRLGFVVTVG
jgi:molybdate transport system substrate-binding protein